MKPPTRRYILNPDHEAVPCPDLMVWARHMVETNPQVGLAQIGPCLVSTVFLGIDMRIFGGSPRLFETMVFDADNSAIFTGRCATWAAAETMHRSVVKQVELGLIGKPEAPESTPL